MNMQVRVTDESRFSGEWLAGRLHGSDEQIIILADLAGEAVL